MSAARAELRRLLDPSTIPTADPIDLHIMTVRALEDVIEEAEKSDDDWETESARADKAEQSADDACDDVCTLLEMLENVSVLPGRDVVTLTAEQIADVVKFRRAYG